MSFQETVVLGALAGFTIYVGLPFGRLQLLSERTRVALAMFSVGVLAFLFVDVFEHAFAIVENAVEGLKEGERSFGDASGLALLLAAGFASGTAGLAMIERWMRPRRREQGAAPIAGGATDALTVDQAQAILGEAAVQRARALRTAMTIAVAIGLHNFAEGLAIGVSAKAGAVGLATVLIIGFGLHNATEGFGIVGPMAATGQRPSWALLGVLGLIGGGPTFIGTVIGRSFVNEPVYVAFLALAAGSILYVVVQLLRVALKLDRTWALYGGLLVGVLLGFATDFVVTAAGA
jgi:zinc transporter, ZIP family